jgi:hypothetical protein
MAGILHFLGSIRKSKSGTETKTPVVGGQPMGNEMQPNSVFGRHPRWVRIVICLFTLFLFSVASAEAGRNHGKRPTNGAVFLQKRDGVHQLIVDNGGDDDAVVKLKELTGGTVLSFYVRAGKQVKIDRVPEGDYKIEFACGSVYSKKEGRFMEYMKAMTFPIINSFVTTIRNNIIYTSSIACTLHQVNDGNVGAVQIASQEFMRD